MMLQYKDIIKDTNPNLRKMSEDVSIPLNEEDTTILCAMNDYLIMGYDEDLATQNDIRPGVGIAAPQINIFKKMFVILAYDEKNKLHNYGVINPKITRHSEELTYIESGEGCLSVEHDEEGYIHRYKRITVEFDSFDFDTKKATKVSLRLKGYIAVVFQHEYDHLFGKLFYDHINKENPFFIPANSTPIKFE